MSSSPHTLRARWLAAALLLASASLHAQTAPPRFPDAQASDPAKMGWMVGFPPPPDRVVRFADGSLNDGLRDLARFGEMMHNDGRFNGQQIVPKAVVDDIRRGADKAHFAKAGYALLPGWSYRNMWWVSHNEHGAYSARGVHGQVVYIDPKAEMVIARYATHPLAANANLDPTSLPAYHALAKHLIANPR